MKYETYTCNYKTVCMYIQLPILLLRVLHCTDNLEVSRLQIYKFSAHQQTEDVAAVITVTASSARLQPVELATPACTPKPSRCARRGRFKYVSSYKLHL